MWIDAHCHLSDPRVADRLSEIIVSGQKVGLSKYLLGGVDPADWERQESLVRAYPGVFFKVFGLHPWWVDEMAQSNPEALSEGMRLLRSKVGDATAVGETGLDGSRGRLKRTREQQFWAFRGQLKLALEIRKPVVLHIVRAHSLALEVLEEQEHSALRGMIHSFSGNRVEAGRYLKLGWLLSFSARITYPEATELREILRECPLNQLAFETDAPDQPPFGHDQAIHTPVSLLKVVEVAAQIRGEAADSLLNQSRDNLVRVFSLSRSVDV
jgi:TatD DNase family protein